MTRDRIDQPDTLLKNLIMFPADKNSKWCKKPNPDV